MNDSEFLDWMEAQEQGYKFTDDDTSRLWKLGGYITPPAHIRVVYLSGRIKKIITNTRRTIAEKIAKRILGDNRTGKP